MTVRSLKFRNVSRAQIVSGWEAAWELWFEAWCYLVGQAASNPINQSTFFFVPVPRHECSPLIVKYEIFLRTLQQPLNQPICRREPSSRAPRPEPLLLTFSSPDGSRQKKASFFVTLVGQCVWPNHGDRRRIRENALPRHKSFKKRKNHFRFEITLFRVKSKKVKAACFGGQDRDFVGTMQAHLKLEPELTKCSILCPELNLYL